MIALLADSASATGQTVVAKVTVSVTITTAGVETPSTAEVARAGQLVMEAAHEVTVRMVVARTVKVV